MNSGEFSNQPKLKGSKKDQYFNSKAKEFEKKKRFQPTPVLTPIISERNSNCPTTIREMEGINQKEKQKLNMLKEYIKSDA